MMKNSKDFILGFLAVAIFSAIAINFDELFYIFLAVIFIAAVVMRFAIKNTQKRLWEGVITATIVITFIFGFLANFVRLRLVQQTCNTYGPDYKAYINNGEFSDTCPYVCENKDKGAFCAKTGDPVKRVNK